MDPQGRRAAGRLAGWLFAAAGAMVVFYAALIGDANGGSSMLTLVGLAAMGVGALSMVAPWDRLPERANLALIVVALVLIALGNRANEADAYTYGVFFVLLFTWVGATQPQGTSAVMGLPAAVAYVVPILMTHGHSSTAVASAVVVVPVCVLVGETVARSLAQLRRSHALDARRVGDLEALVGAAAVLQGSTEADSLGDVLASVSTSVLHGSGATVLFDDGGGKLVPAGNHPPLVEGAISVAPPPAAVDEAVRTSLPAQEGATLVLPLPGRDKVLGVVAVYFQSATSCDQFTLHAAQLLGSQMVLALEQMHAIEQLTEAAMQDALTGVGNRRRAAALLEDLKPGDAVVLIDLDHFKLVNDTAGHAAGDKVLVALGRFLRDKARDADTVARYGGEEFLVVLRKARGAGLSAAWRLIEDWRAEKPLTTFSAGVALHKRGRSPAATLGRADAALYRAKRTGRDRACEDGAEVLEPEAH